MSRPILVANWKNYPNSLAETRTLLGQLSKDVGHYKKLSVFIAPPFPYFESVYLRTRSFARLASQDIFPDAEGAHTGSVTSDILKSFGVKLAIIGHSERRALGETNELIAEKVRMALSAGIVPLICVGEISRDEDGEHFELLRKQLKFSLAGLNKKDATKLAIAYEPVWAVGKYATGVMSTADLGESVIYIKKVLTEVFGREVAEQVPILYGGSVEPDNAGLLIGETGVRGLLVGRASLDAKKFKSIAQSLIKK